jgi:hypothetical protein
LIARSSSISDRDQQLNIRESNHSQNCEIGEIKLSFSALAIICIKIVFLMARQSTKIKNLIENVDEMQMKWCDGVSFIRFDDLVKQNISTSLSIYHAQLSNSKLLFCENKNNHSIMMISLTFNFTQNINQTPISIFISFHFISFHIMMNRHTIAKAKSKSKPKVKFEPWEDQRLIDAIHAHGPNDWKTIAIHIPGRNPRQCRERWTNYINPNILKTQWTDIEDQIILNTYNQIGPKWFVIASNLPGRPRNSVKNRYFALQRKTEFNSINRAQFPPDHSTQQILQIQQTHQQQQQQQPQQQTDCHSEIAEWNEFMHDHGMFDWDQDADDPFNFYF